MVSVTTPTLADIEAWEAAPDDGYHTTDWQQGYVAGYRAAEAEIAPIVDEALALMVPVVNKIREARQKRE